MQGYSYSVFSGVAIAIHLIINFKLLRGQGALTERAARYRGFLFGVLAYYITDAAWGVVAGLDWTGILYVDTVFFFLSLVAFVFMWCRFVIAYLEFDKLPAQILSWSGYALLAFNLAALATNPFNKCFFYIDSHGVYQTGGMRDPAFCLPLALNVLTAFFLLAKAFGSGDAVRRRSMMIFICCVTMAAALVLQIIWPLTPFTSLGCLVSNCFLHIYVITDEQTAKHMAQLENALERARAAEKARSLFFSTVSHDIRTPLNAIIGYSELLLGGIPDELERSRALSAISTSGHTLLQLINDVLDLSKLESGKMVIRPVPTDVRDLVSSVLHSFDVTVKGSDVELKEEYGDLPLLEIDPQRIRQILFNLVGNAVKFTEHGEIRVSASFRNGSGEGKGVFTLSVADTGCGIADEDREKLMRPFVQVGADAQTRGTGLGLAICKQLAAGMGGELSFVSELGKGTTFTLELPDVKSDGPLPDPAGRTVAAEQDRACEDQPEPPAVEITGEVRKHAGEYRVLIADDVPLNLAVLKALLRKVGVNDIVAVVNGQEAWEKLHVSKKKFDCVLTDVWMPKLNGRELVSKIRADERLADLPVYAVTADIEEIKNFPEHKFTGTLLKPLTIEKLSRLFK